MIPGMIRNGLVWKVVILTVILHVVMDAGTTFLTWHQAIGEEKWEHLSWHSYACLALYVKLITGVCGTIVALKDTSWQAAREKLAEIEEGVEMIDSTGRRASDEKATM